jgi:uncharacterized iron-regulated protein
MYSRSLLLLLPLLLAFRADKPAYVIYTETGRAASYDKLLDEAAKADVVLFGELHNNPICHWLELQLTRDLARERGSNLVLGAEMFETDNQQPLTKYVNGQLSAKEFAGQARLWPNYDTDYKPVVDVAREQKIPFVATNVPRRYASLVARNGLTLLDTATAESKKLMATLPLKVDLNLPGYKAMLTMMEGHGGGPAASGGSMQGGGSPADNFAKAQALKDATMARFILDNWKPGQTLLHFNGDYHSKNFDGIVWYLRQQKSDLTIVTISSVEAEVITKAKPDWKGLGTYVLAIPADMTKTH